jgi:hypothetical protein
MRSRIPVTKEASMISSSLISAGSVPLRVVVMLRSFATAALVSEMSSPSQIWRLVFQRSSKSSEFCRTYQDSLRLFVNVCHHLNLSHLLVLVILIDTHCVNPYWRVQNVP